MTSDRKPTPAADRLREELAGALAPVVEREAAEAGPHPTLDELVRYHGGELDDAEERRVRRHLVVCAECLEDLLDLDGFVGTGAAPPEELPGGSPGRAGRFEPWRPALALAASMLLVISILAFWALRERGTAEDLRATVAELAAPRPDVPIVDLLPDSALRGGETGRRAAELPADEDHVTLVLNLPQAAEHTAFEAELVDAAGRVAWSGTLERSSYGTFTLGLSRRSLSPGENRIRLYGVGDRGRRLLETYTLEVAPDGGS